MTKVREMLRDYTELLNRFGPDSTEAAEYLEARRFNSEFAELAELSRRLKKALTAPVANHRSCV